jgi:hypothetical protein
MCWQPSAAKSGTVRSSARFLRFKTVLGCLIVVGEHKSGQNRKSEKKVETAPLSPSCSALIFLDVVLGRNVFL